VHLDNGAREALSVCSILLGFFVRRFLVDAQSRTYVQSRGSALQARNRTVTCGDGDARRVRSCSAHAGNRLCKSGLFTGLSRRGFGTDHYIWIHGHGHGPLRLVQVTQIYDRTRKGPLRRHSGHCDWRDREVVVLLKDPVHAQRLGTCHLPSLWH
jgi:hypothetical protein